MQIEILNKECYLPKGEATRKDSLIRMRFHAMVNLFLRAHCDKFGALKVCLVIQMMIEVSIALQNKIKRGENPLVYERSLHIINNFVHKVGLQNQEVIPIIFKQVKFDALSSS